jgi:ankyrin repeat protein
MLRVFVSLAVALGSAFGAEVDFEKDVKPIFRDKCYSCHGPTQQMSGLRLDQRESALMGGRGRPDLVPGAVERSSIYLRVAGTEQGTRMPLTGPLSAEEIATIKAWIEQGAKWPDEPAAARDWQPDARLSPLFEQIRQGNFQAARDAVTADAGLLRARDARGDTLLMQAALYGTAEHIQWLLERGADANLANLAGATALLWAIDDAAKVRALLEAQANPNAHTGSGRTALIAALEQKRASAVVGALLDKGASANPEPGQPDPLVLASANGDLESIRLLLRARGGKFPPGSVAAAAQSGCLECLRLVLDREPPKDVLSDAFRFTARLAPLEALEALLDAGADVNAKDDSGATALLRAAYSDYADPARVKLLLDHGADVNVRDAAGDTPLMKARRRGATEVAELIVSAGARE